MRPTQTLLSLSAGREVNPIESIHYPCIQDGHRIADPVYVEEVGIMPLQLGIMIEDVEGGYDCVDRRRRHRWVRSARENVLQEQ